MATATGLPTPRLAKSHELKEPMPPPYWEAVRLADGRAGARVWCWFGHPINLTDYVVLPTGFFAPGEVVCNYPGCTFKAHLRLRGWPPVAI